MGLLNLFSRNYKSLILVILQFSFLIWLWLTGPLLPLSAIPFTLVIAGILLGLWAVSIMKQKSRIQITPDTTPDTKLISTGPYRYLRHPMYTGLLLLGLGLLLEQPELWRVVSYIGLIVTLIYKARFEESILLKAFAEYGNYQKKTWALIPCIF